MATDPHPHPRAAPATSPARWWCAALALALAACGGRAEPGGGPVVIGARDGGAATVVDAATSDATVGPATPTPSEQDVLAALADAITRDDGAGFAALVDPQYGLTASYFYGYGSALTELDHVEASDPTPPSRRRGRATGHTPAIWGRGRWKGVAAVITAQLPDVDVDPGDTSSFRYGVCRRARAQRSEPLAAYLRHGQRDDDLHSHDGELDGGPPVPPLADLTVFGNARIEIYLRRSADGWRAVRVVFDESCAAGPDP